MKAIDAETYGRKCAYRMWAECQRLLHQLHHNKRTHPHRNLCRFTLGAGAKARGYEPPSRTKSRENVSLLSLLVNSILLRKRKHAPIRRES